MPNVLEALLIEAQRQLVKWGCVTVVIITILFSLSQVYMTYRIEASLSNLQTTTQSMIDLIGGAGMQIEYERNISVEQNNNESHSNTVNAYSTP